MNQFRSPDSSFDAVNELCNISCLNPGQLLEALEINIKEAGKKWAGCCPVHGGDNQTAFNFYPDGDTVPGYWVCRTHSCQNKFGKNLIGLIKGIKNCGFNDAVKWLLNYNGIKSLDKVKLPPRELLEKRKANRIYSKLNIFPSLQTTNQWDRQWVRKVLKPPSDYYIKRGYSIEILDKYDVGYYDAQKRVSVPVYDNDYKYCVGFTARSIYDPCSKCGYYHDVSSACPSKENVVNYFKWRNSKDFECGNYLYNYWFAKNHILKTGVAILVEGPGDVWRLEQQGIRNSLALFGVDIKEPQRVLLDGSGALSIIVMLDNDDAGVAGALTLKKNLGRTYRLFFPKINQKDVGELHSDFITNEIEPLIRRLKND